MKPRNRAEGMKGLLKKEPNDRPLRSWISPFTTGRRHLARTELRPKARIGTLLTGGSSRPSQNGEWERQPRMKYKR